MKLIFERQEGKSDVLVFLDQGGKIDFNYIDLVKSLASGTKLKVAPYVGEFSEEEKASISRMVNELNALANKNKLAPPP